MTSGSTPDQLYQIAVGQAVSAFNHGTFAVGGLLMHKGGAILKTIRNDVVRDGHVYDPTAHVERQLVDWYHEQKSQGLALPPTGECVIVSSLDPCIMCGGAALASGFQVVTANLDPFVSVNWTGDMNFDAVPDSLRDKAREIFAYMGVAGQSQSYRGSMRHIFAGAAVSQDIVGKSERYFMDSVVQVRALINASNQKDPESYRNKPTTRHVQLLEDLADRAYKAGHRHQAGLLIAPQGNVLYSAHDLTSLSPIATPMMQVMRGYMKERWNQLSKGEAPDFPHPKQCVYLQLYGPGEAASDLADLGAFGSTMEGPLPDGNKQAFQYVHESIPADRLGTLMQNLPPYYREFVGIQPVKATFC